MSFVRGGISLQIPLQNYTKNLTYANKLAEIFLLSFF